MRLMAILDNIRSIHNVGSIFRSADCLGVEKIYLCGITPHPEKLIDENRLPHIVSRIERDLHKTALGAEHTVAWEYCVDTITLIKYLKKDGWRIIALEQHGSSIALDKYVLEDKSVLILGNELSGIEIDILAMCDEIVEISMQGKKESLNVSVAAAIAFYSLRR